MSRIKDLVGMRFGRLLVLERARKPPNLKNKSTYWKCSCDCGNEKIVLSSSLIRGETNSCGCLKKDSQIKRRLGYGKASFNRLFRNYKRVASNRDIKFELSEEEFEVLTKGNCYYCGKQPEQRMSGGDTFGEYVYNGIDRVNSVIGYKLENCVSCCSICNRMKSDMSIKEFTDHIKRIANHDN